MTSSVAAVADGQEELRAAGHVFTDADWSNPSKVDGGLAPYVASKFHAERFAWDFVKTHPDGFTLTCINPALVLGPCLAPHHMSSPIAVYKLLGRKMPAVPSMHFGIVDVRDVAAAHIAASASPDAVGKRFILCAGGMWMTDIAKVLSDHFDKLGFNVPTHRLPTFLLKVVGIFDSTVRMAAGMADKETLFNGTPAHTVLGVNYRTLQDSIIACGYSLISLDVIPAPIGLSLASKK
jgi:dihydroflavonol-4-reductase